MDANCEEATSKAAGQGTEHAENDTSEERFLKEYPKPSLTADIAVFRQSEAGLAVLMVRRGKHPFKGCWALPGGFVGPNEDVVDAARRELEEETGVSGISVELFGIYGTPGRDPRGWTVSGGFCAVVDASQNVKAGDDAADARWCPICEKPNDGTSSADVVEIEVTCGEEDVLTARFELIAQDFGSPRARVVESEGFAFDHAQLLADAFLKVQ